MKSYRSAAAIVSDIERVLIGNRPSFQHSPLEDVLRLLSDGRHYSWIGIYLLSDKNSSPVSLQETAHAASIAVPGTRKKVLVSLKIAGRELGFLDVESDRTEAFGTVDRVLLERVASLLARFLMGRGKYLLMSLTRSGIPKSEIGKSVAQTSR